MCGSTVGIWCGLGQNPLWVFSSSLLYKFFNLPLRVRFSFRRSNSRFFAPSDPRLKRRLDSFSGPSDGSGREGAKEESDRCWAVALSIRMEREVCWPYFDPEYENLSQRINPPSVKIDNDSCANCTLVKVDSMNKPGILLEVVQVLCDIDLTITKAYISSDGGWFMDVFHVTDQQGKKLVDKKSIEYIEEALGPKSKIRGINRDDRPGKTIGMHSIGHHTAIELIGTDRPGLLSEICAVLTDQQCNVVAAEAWTHKTRVACVVYVNDGNSSGALSDPHKLSVMEEQLKNVLGGGERDGKKASTTFSVGSTHVDRRLHQLMFSDMDYQITGEEREGKDAFFKPSITIDYCQEKGYSVVNIHCKDRPKLLFDIVCTLTDMHYVVFHASISSDGPHALQEYYIRHEDGCILDSEDTKEKVIKCLEAAILRRVTEGLSLELCATDRIGLLSDVTRILREHGLSVLRAGVSTIGGQATNVFYIRDSSGNPVDMKAIESLRREIGQSVMFNVKKVPTNVESPQTNAWAKTRFSFGSLFERFLA